MSEAGGDGTAAPDPAAGGTPVRMAHTVTGSGPALLLLPGTGYAGSTWHPSMVATLAAAGRTVVTFDYRGTGRTPGTDGAYSTRGFARDVVALMDELGIARADVLGHSMGGRVAQWVALDAPARVRSLVLAASGPGGGSATGHAQPAGLPLEATAVLIELGYEGYLRRQIATTFFTPEYGAAHPEVVTWLQDAFWAARPPIRDYLKHVVARQAHDTVARLGEIAAPACVIVGDRDTHVGGTGSHLDQSRFLAASLPRAELHLVPGAAHGYFWSHADASLPPIEAFLRRLDDAGA